MVSLLPSNEESLLWNKQQSFKPPTLFLSFEWPPSLPSPCAAVPATTMAKNHRWLPLILSLITALGLAASSLCIVSEFKRTKRKDLKLDGKLCHLPGSHAFGFGIAALICLFAAQVAGNFIVCRNSCSGEKRTRCKARKPALSTIFLLLSWISFGIAAILLSVASSMNRRQPYGKGWLDGDCYVVKDGVYIGAATLALVCVALALASAIISIRKSQTEQGQKIHAQI